MRAFGWLSLVAALAQSVTVSAQQIGPGASAPASDELALSLQEAVARAVGDSEEVRLARADVDAAATRIRAAQAQRLPQVSASTSYARTLQSPFQSGGNFTLPPADRFNPDPTAPLEQRVTYLEQNSDKAVLTTLTDLLSSSLQSVGLGSPHSYAVSLTGSQLLYSGGRVGAAVSAARDIRDAALFNVREEAAAVELDVRTAYFRALLSKELEAIAEAALVQAESFLNQERQRLTAGFASDLDVLRAEVSLENLRPQLVDARNALELALLNLKRLTNIPLERAVRLTTSLEVPVGDLSEVALTSSELLGQRAAVQAVDKQVAAREQNVRAARAAYRPSVSLQLSYAGQVYPNGIVDFSGARWQPTSSATLGVQVPIFNGFQRAADVGQAQVQLRQAQLQSAQLRESVQLQYEQALGERERARATIAARQRTVDQAQRVYDLTILRYQQGQATQLEISDSRLSSLQARTNLAQALADFYIASAGVTRAQGATSVPMPTTVPNAVSLRSETPGSGTSTRR